MKKGYKMEIKNNLWLIKLVTKSLIHYFNFYFLFSQIYLPNILLIDLYVLCIYISI